MEHVLCAIWVVPHFLNLMQSLEAGPIILSIVQTIQAPCLNSRETGSRQRSPESPTKANFNHVWGPMDLRQHQGDCWKCSSPALINLFHSILWAKGSSVLLPPWQIPQVKATFSASSHLCPPQPPPPLPGVPPTRGSDWLALPPAKVFARMWRNWNLCIAGGNGKREHYGRSSKKLNENYHMF